MIVDAHVPTCINIPSCTLIHIHTVLAFTIPREQVSKVNVAYHEAYLISTPPITVIMITMMATANKMMTIITVVGSSSILVFVGLGLVV